MVHCGPHEGRHTAELVADRIDQVIESLGIVGMMETQKGITTDNAPNMTSASKKAVHIDSSHGCFDHQLNLIVKNGLKRVPAIITAVQHFKRLATATHKSSLFCGRIKQECSELEKSHTKYTTNIKYVKMIQPQDTRWNSTLMCIRSIINLETPLLEIKKISGRAVTQDKTLENLQLLIPTKRHFDELRHIMPLLSVFEKVSEQMSAEKVPTLCWVTFRAYYLRIKCDPIESPQLYPLGLSNLRALAAEFYKELKRRFPFDCTELYEPTICGFLNPAVKDFMWNIHNNGTKILREMRKREEGVTEPKPMVVDATIDLEDEDNIISQRSQAMAPQTTGSEESKFLVEVAVYLSLNRSKTSVDILEFWSDNEKRMPILARTVRKYMCIQASSSSSERTFSASGNIVTPRRNKLDPENVNMLVYLKENLGKVELPKLFPKPPSATSGGAARVEEDLDDTDFAASP